MDLNLDKLTIQEKLQAMEMLWDDICRNVSDIPSPTWHEKLLKKREQQLQEGVDTFIDWDQAKNEIRKSIS
jgi:putative addiction module component (TIGR02574 family)